MEIERGWFYLADLSPQRGTEPGKTRPVLVVQTNLLNSQGHPSTVAIPLSCFTHQPRVPMPHFPKTGAGNLFMVFGEPDIELPKQLTDC